MGYDARLEPGGAPAYFMVVVEDGGDFVFAIPYPTWADEVRELIGIGRREPFLPSFEPAGEQVEVQGVTWHKLRRLVR